ncbi:MAG: hypothetical protein J6386_15670 [Candidatus Synoicihabitans palmerolidicus]|nr:hypothetical protein [Candidatus Synoicihabitans palmerolidicus]
MGVRSTNQLRDSALPIILLIGDTLVAFGGLSFGYWLRYVSVVGSLGIDVPEASYTLYLPLLLVGVIFLVGAFAQRGLYDGKVLLRKQHALNLLTTRATVFGVIVYLALSLVIKFEPLISWLFVVMAGSSTLLLLWLWRELFYSIVTRPSWLPHLQRRVALLGWSESAQSLLDDVQRGRTHPYQVIGCIAGSDMPVGLRDLGSMADWATTLQRERMTSFWPPAWTLPILN